MNESNLSALAHAAHELAQAAGDDALDAIVSFEAALYNIGHTEEAPHDNPA